MTCGRFFLHKTVPENSTVAGIGSNQERNVLWIRPAICLGGMLHDKRKTAVREITATHAWWTRWQPNSCILICCMSAVRIVLSAYKQNTLSLQLFNCWLLVWSCTVMCSELYHIIGKCIVTALGVSYIGMKCDHSGKFAVFYILCIFCNKKK